MLIDFPDVSVKALNVRKAKTKLVSSRLKFPQMLKLERLSFKTGALIAHHNLSLKKISGQGNNPG